MNYEAHYNTLIDMFAPTKGILYDDGSWSRTRFKHKLKYGGVPKKSIEERQQEIIDQLIEADRLADALTFMRDTDPEGFDLLCRDYIE